MINNRFRMTAPKCLEYGIVIAGKLHTNVATCVFRLASTVSKRM